MNSIWWQVAGWTMIHFLWIGSLVFLVTALVRLALFRAAPQWRYAASLLGLAVLAVSPPLIALRIASEIKPLAVVVEPIAQGVEDRYAGPLAASSSAASLPEAAPPAPAVIDLKYTPITVEAPSVEAPLEASPTETVVVSQAIAPPAPVSDEPMFDPQLLLQALPSYLPWLWMIGTPATLLLLATGLMGSERLRRRAEPITDPVLLETLARLTAALRIGRQVSLAVSDRVLQPVLVGIVRPLVLLPSVALTSWSPAEIEMALVHELAHVRRWDNLMNLMQRLVESLLFFHPAVWITSRWVRADREHCCDAVVVAHCGNREAYASLLVSVAKSSVTRRLPSPAMAMASHPLAKRVRRILQLEDDPMLVSKRTLLSVAVLLAALTAGAVWSSTQAEEAKASESEPVSRVVPDPGDEVDDRYAIEGRTEEVDEPFVIDTEFRDGETTKTYSYDENDPADKSRADEILKAIEVFEKAGHKVSINPSSGRVQVLVMRGGTSAEVFAPKDNASDVERLFAANLENTSKKSKREPEASAPGVEEVTAESTEDAEKKESIILHPELTEAELADIRKTLAAENTGYSVSVNGSYVFLRSNDGLVKARRLEIKQGNWRVLAPIFAEESGEHYSFLLAEINGLSQEFETRCINQIKKDLRDHTIEVVRSDWGPVRLLATPHNVMNVVATDFEGPTRIYDIDEAIPAETIKMLIVAHEKAGNSVMIRRGDRDNYQVVVTKPGVASDKPGEPEAPVSGEAAPGVEELTTESTEDAGKRTDQQVAAAADVQPKRALAAFYFANVGVGRGNDDPARHAERIAKHDAEFTSAKALEGVVSRLKLADSIDAEWLKDHLKLKRVNDWELQVAIECGPEDDISQGQVSELMKEVVNAYFLRQFPHSDDAGHLGSLWHLSPKMDPEDFEKARIFFRENTDWTFRLGENSVSLSARGDVFVFDEILIVGDLIIGLAGSPQSIKAFTEAQASTAKDEAEKNWSPINPMVNKPPFLSLEDQRIADLAYGMLGVEVAAIDAEELAAVKEKGFAGGVKMESSAGRRQPNGIQGGDILVGLHVWPTADLDQLAEVLRRGDLNQFTPLKYFVLRQGIRTEYVKGSSPDSRHTPVEVPSGEWTLHTGRVSFDTQRWSQEQQRLKQIELKAEQDAGKTTLLPLPGQPGAVKVGPAEAPAAAAKEPENPPPIATTPIAEPADAEPIKPAPPQLLYDGRTFDDWRTEWKTELKTENRTEAIKALRAFGRAGYGKEATEAILEVAEEYPMISIGHEGSPKETLQTAIVYSFVDINDSSPIPSEVSLPVILDWYDASQENRVRLAAWVLSNTASKDVKLLDRIAALADNSTMALDVLQHLIASDPKLNQERTQKVLRKCLASDEQGIAVGAIMSLMPRRMVASASGNYESVVELRTLPTSLPPLLFHEEPRLRQYARLVLNHAKPDQLEDLPELLMTIAEKPGASATFRGAAVVEKTDDAKVQKARRLDALRALAAIGTHAHAMSERVFALFAVEDDDTKKLGEWVISNLHTTKLPHGGLRYDVPKELYDRIEAMKKDQPDLRTEIDWEREAIELFPQDQFGGGGGFRGDMGGGGMF
ncbi:M56 family metallopeptidase [Aeoliella sp. SH292]|uniref:M56 family metallopeptidase n=1 Tax=Aeoliella sp. SH292 TaxID=3454464 RepID=UPI003F9E3882